jgi:hypothetical protein
MTTLTAKLPWGEKLRLSVDLGQASAGISYERDGEWVDTPYQTADASHDADRAVRLVLDWFGRSYFAEPDDERPSDLILDEVMAMITITRDDEPEDE